MQQFNFSPIVQRSVGPGFNIKQLGLPGVKDPDINSPEPTPVTDNTIEIKIGDTIRGFDMDNGVDDIEGTVIRLVYDEKNELISYEILDTKNKQRNLDATTVEVISNKVDKVELKENSVYNNKILKFDEWLNKKD